MKLNQKEGVVFILCGPSGVGKTTVTHKVLEQLSQFPIKRVITYTTRAPRTGEIHGNDYFFISEEQFQLLKKQGFFFETDQFNNHFYASPISFITDTQKGISSIALLTLGVAKEVANKASAKKIFIGLLPPNIETLKTRLETRGTDAPEIIKKRVALGKKEIETLSKNELFILMINDNLEKTVQALVSLIKKHIAI